MTRSRRLRLPSPSWLRLPRRTARLRLTLLSGSLFLLAGAALLTVTYLLFEQGAGAQQSAGGPGGGPTSASGPFPGVAGEGQIANPALGAARRAAATAQLAADRHVLLVDLGPIPEGLCRPALNL